MTLIKKHKNLIIFIILTLLRSVFMWMMKFFLRSYLQDARTLQEIAGYASLGSAIAYLFAGAVAYAFTKKKIILRTALVCILALLVGYFTHYAPFLLFAVLLSVMWVMYSLWLTVKSVILSTEIITSWFSETAINGMANVAILVGFLLGSYRWFAAYTKFWGFGFLAIVVLLLVCWLLWLFLSYDKLFTPKPFVSNIKTSIPNILEVTERYFRFLVPIAVLRAVSTVMGQKMLEIWINTFDKMPKASIFVLVVSFVGAIVGNIISAFIKTNKKVVTLVFLIILGRSMILFPHFLHEHTNYFFLQAYSFMIGMFFGIAVNIIEWRYFHLIGDDHKKEYGAAAYGLISSIVMFFIMIISDLLTRGFGDKFAFFFCGIVVLINIFFLKKIEETAN